MGGAGGAGHPVGGGSSAAAAEARRAANKMALSPISQEEFDKYSHINTELLVRKVRFLSLIPTLLGK